MGTGRSDVQGGGAGAGVDINVHMGPELAHRRCVLQRLAALVRIDGNRQRRWLMGLGREEGWGEKGMEEEDDMWAYT